MEECIRFIEAKGLHRCSARTSGRAVVRATGGGAIRFAEARFPLPRVPLLRGLQRLRLARPPAAQLFRSRLGLTLEKEDEMGSVVCGANFLLQEARPRALGA